MIADATFAPATEDDLTTLDRWWRAANYLSVGQIYLFANPLLAEPLAAVHIKPRLLGHWGTTPGLNFVYAHLNRVIRARDLDMLFVAGPGHGGPAVVANAWLEGTYSETYPRVSLDASGMERLFARSLSRAASQATQRRKRPDPSTREANSVTRSPTPTEQRSTTPTSSLPVLSVTEKPKPARWPPVGTPTNSSIPSTTARYSRSCT